MKSIRSEISDAIKQKIRNNINPLNIVFDKMWWRINMSINNNIAGAITSSINESFQNLMWDNKKILRK